MTATTTKWLRCALVGLGAASAAGCSQGKVETGRHRSDAREVTQLLVDASAAAPGDARDFGDAVSDETVAAATALEGLIEARVYFAKQDAVAAAVKGYFQALNKRSHNLQLREVSPAEDPHAARAVAGPDGRMVAIDYGSRRRAIGLTVRGDEVDLLDLDTVVRAVLLKLAPQHDSGTVYRTVGHGELAGQSGAKDPAAWGSIRTLLADLGYALGDLGRRQLAAGVPEDAKAVLLLGPTTALDARERAALERYVASGGALLVAFDLSGRAPLTELASYLGVRFEPTLLADDEHKVRSAAGAVHPTTNSFADHPAVAGAHKSRIWVPLFRSGTLRDAARRGRVLKARRTNIVTSAASAFLDRNRNGAFDAGAEKRGAYTVAVAIEATAGKSPGRAAVCADADLFRSDVLGHFRGAHDLCADVLRWLLRETKDGASEPDK